MRVPQEKDSRLVCVAFRPRTTYMEVTVNFKTHNEAEAFHQGVQVALGLLGQQGLTLILGNILPLTSTGYSTSVSKGESWKMM